MFHVNPKTPCGLAGSASKTGKRIGKRFWTVSSRELIVFSAREEGLFVKEVPSAWHSTEIKKFLTQTEGMYRPARVGTVYRPLKYAPCAPAR